MLGKSAVADERSDEDGDEPLDFPTEVVERLDRLFERRIATFGAIIASLARDAGYGELASLPPQTRRALEEAVEEACDDWRVAAEALNTAEPMLPHERLLRDYVSLGETILDVQSAALGRTLHAAPQGETVWRVQPIASVTSRA